MGPDHELTWRAPATRLDRALRSVDASWGRSLIGELISSRRVRVNSRIVWMASWQVERGDRLVVEGRVDAGLPVFPTFDPAWLVSDDGDIVVVDKPSGLRSEAVRADDDTPNLLRLARPAFGNDLALAHRLDRDTSGLVMLTRPGSVRAELDGMFRTHTISKRYEAVVPESAALGDGGRLVHFLAEDPQRRDLVVVVLKGGRKAVTDYVVSSRANGFARLELWPRTGRTHQLRVQCAHMNVPILGDRLYGEGASAARLLLHAASLDLPPLGHHAARQFHAPTPF